MAKIETPQAVKFCNEKVRPFADRIAQLKQEAKQLQDEWFALGGSDLVPNTTDTIADGAITDGRTIITGADVNNVINRAIEIVTDLEADGNAKLNTILKVAVNTGAR